MSEVPLYVENLKVLKCHETASPLAPNFDDTLGPLGRIASQKVNSAAESQLCFIKSTLPQNVNSEAGRTGRGRARNVQGYLAQKKTPTPLGTPKDPRHRPTVES